MPYVVLKILNISLINQINIIKMGKIKRKLMLKKETISNLSKFEQGHIIGGYEPDSEKPGWNTLCILWSMIRYSHCDDLACDTIYKDTCYCPTNLFDGGTCDSTVDTDVTCQGWC